MYPQKSRIYPHTRIYHIAVNHTQLETTFNRLLYEVICKRALYIRKEPYISAKEPYISAKEPYISAKEPYTSAHTKVIFIIQPATEFTEFTRKPYYKADY